MSARRDHHAQYLYFSRRKPMFSSSLKQEMTRNVRRKEASRPVLGFAGAGCRRFGPRQGGRGHADGKEQSDEERCDRSRASRTKTGRSIAGNALAIGGLAAIAGLGYQAYKNYQAGQAPAASSDAPSANNPVLLPPPVDSGFGPASPAGSNEFVLVLIRAMIAAAKADGHIDGAERALIMDKIKAADVSGEAAAFIERELASPTDIDAIVAAAVTEEQRVELYTASRLTIEPDSRAERGYLDLLAGRLGLADQLVDHIEATVSSAKTTLSQ